MCFRFFINIYSNIAVQGKLTVISMFLPTAPRQFCLLSYWLVAGIWEFPSGFLIPFKNYPQPLGISHQLSYAHLAMPNGCLTAFKSISQWLLAKMWQFPSFFSEGLRFCQHLLKVEGAFKNNQQLLLYYRSIQEHKFQPVSISCDSLFNGIR